MPQPVDSQLKILDEIPVLLDAEKVLQPPAKGGDGRPRRIVSELLETVLPLARPRATYKVSRVTAKNGDEVTIDGVAFLGRVLSVHLDVGKEVYPFVSTCGRELDNVVLPKDDLLNRYYLDVIKGLVLASATDYLREHLRERCGGRVARISPGELEFWPISQQRPLFELLGPVEETIGVRLSENLTMSPAMSVSGIFFRDDTFESCQLCAKPCKGRRMAYDGGLVARYR